MSKKIIAATVALTLVFVFVFTACKGNNLFTQAESTTELNTVYGGYGDLYVTDENGNKVFNKDGAALVYVTDANGNIVTNAEGVPESQIKPFVPISEAGRVEYLGYSLVLPEGWTITTDSNRYENTSAGHYVVITPQNESYDSYYQTQRSTYDALAAEAPDSVSWTEDIGIGSGCIKVVRFTLKGENDMKVMYFFENSGNLYKIWFNSTNPDTILNDSIAFCKAINYKPYKYFPEESTQPSTTATTATTVAD